MFQLLVLLFIIKLYARSNIFQNCFATRRWSFLKQHRKGTAKATPKFETKSVYYIFTENICSACNAM